MRAGWRGPELCNLAAVHNVRNWRDVIDLECHDIAAAEPTVDCETEQSKIADTRVDLELGPNGPNVLGTQLGLLGVAP